MELGYRIIRPQDVGLQPLAFAQISLWRTAAWDIAVGERAVTEAIEIAAVCKTLGIRTVFHPLEYPLTTIQASQTMNVMRRLAAASDLGIIVHDEGGAGGERISAAEEAMFKRNLAEISGLCHVSIENSFNSGDIIKFWERFVLPAREGVSITIDIGHLESAAIDSISFICTLPDRLLSRVHFAHVHHKAEDRSGIKDHLPLVPGCREIEALKELIRRRPDVRVVLELDAGKEGMGQSIELLKGF
jgi:sugar phosphate isomerase/epimerase